MDYHTTGSTMDWLEIADRKLSSSGLKKGQVRTAVLEILNSQECALSASQIHHRLQSKRKTALPSVYRILEALEELNIVQKVEIGDGLTYYEAVREKGHHHHLVCDSCGELKHFEDANLEESLQGLGKRLGLDISAHEVILHGECQECSPEEESKP